jgi:hypothetical protein
MALMEAMAAQTGANVTRRIKVTMFFRFRRIRHAIIKRRTMPRIRSLSSCITDLFLFPWCQ